MAKAVSNHLVEPVSYPINSRAEYFGHVGPGYPDVRTFQGSGNEKGGALSPTVHSQGVINTLRS